MSQALLTEASQPGAFSQKATRRSDPYRPPGLKRTTAKVAPMTLATTKSLGAEPRLV